MECPPGPRKAIFSWSLFIRSNGGTSLKYSKKKLFRDFKVNNATFFFLPEARTLLIQIHSTYKFKTIVRITTRNVTALHCKNLFIIAASGSNISNASVEWAWTLFTKRNIALFNSHAGQVVLVCQTSKQYRTLSVCVGLDAKTISISEPIFSFQSI